MEKTDVLVIGGSAAGLVASLTAKSNNPEKDVTVIRKEEKVMIPCGIPYIFGTLDDSEKNILPDAGLNKLGVNIMIDEVVSVDKENKVCKTKSGTELSYEKLIMATGSMPKVPRWLKGTDLENVFTVPKNKVYLDRFYEKISSCKKAVVIGAGFIGVEFADELNKKDMEVTLIEIMPNILSAAFDEELAVRAEEILKDRGVEVKTNTGVKEILGNEKVTGVLFNNGEKMEADVVILSMGYGPNIELAKQMDLEINELGFIKADQFRRTNYPDVFAVGDCAEKRDFATGKLSAIMLASTACAEARVAGMNLYKLSTVKKFNGTLGVFSTSIGDTAFGAAGLIESLAVKEGFSVVTGTFEGVDRHPGKLPNAHKQLVKLIVSKECGRIIGGEVIGGSSAGEIVNVMSFIIQNGMTVNDMLVAQIGTQPMLTSSPAAYPLIKAAEVVAKELKKK
jgi:NADPH-dependent 2,4-dienoyl-CoA reductase/sulfur reductase-like enzyme